MQQVYEVDQTALVHALAEQLKKDEGIYAPEWAKFVKTGHFKERPPVNADWWFVRSAAVLRKVFRKGPIGTERLRSEFSGRKNRGVRPEKTFRCSGNALRKMLQQLEKSGYIEHKDKGTHKGRIITSKGRTLLKSTAGQLNGAKSE